MNKEEQIRITEELLEGVKELNGEYQEGWKKVIENAEELIAQLQVENHVVLGDVMILFSEYLLTDFSIVDYDDDSVFQLGGTKQEYTSEQIVKMFNES